MAASNFFARIAVQYKNTMNQGCSELLGLVEGVLADKQLVDAEIQFLNTWLSRHEAIATQWPGDFLYGKIKAILADGIVTNDERRELAAILTKLIGGSLDEVAESPRVNELAFDEEENISLTGNVFCLSGDFACMPKVRCESTIAERGGVISQSVTKKIHYLIVGGLGSPEWKHGSYGTKIAKAVEYRSAGVPLRIFHERHLTKVLYI